MKEKIGEVFNIVKDNVPVKGCTISKALHDGENAVICFSLASNTDISAEIFPYYKLIIMAEGSLEVYGKDGSVKQLKTRDSILIPEDTPIGMRTKTGAVYTEIEIERNNEMNETIQPGNIFNLANLVPYADGKIVNMDVIHNAKMKFVVMAFDEGTGLSEHAAPGEALIFALDGEGVIGYEGQSHHIKAGENFCFAKGGMHFVKAEKRFKMALLITLD